MPRYRGYDLDELRAAWESGRFNYSNEVMEYLGIDEKHQRSVQANIRKYYGRRPPAAWDTIKTDWVKRAVIDTLVQEPYNLRRDYCGACQRYCGFDVYLRQMDVMGGGLDKVMIIGKCCVRNGDY